MFPLEDLTRAQKSWIRGRPVRALSLVSKDSEFNASVRPSVVKIFRWQEKKPNQGDSINFLFNLS